MAVDFARLQAQYAAAASLLRNPGATAHFVGIAGVGMAGLATLMRSRGISVSGCDSHTDAPTLPPLRSLGIDVASGHDPAHVSALPADTGFVVRTPAAAPASPELSAAAAAGLPVLDRGPVLAAFLDSLDVPLIAVCGTHGKTTTATFASSLLRSIGLSSGWCIGSPDGAAHLATTRNAVRRGADSSAASPFVAECDESDGSLALYHPAITIVGSVDFDHAEHFASEAEFLSAFDAVLSQTRHAVIYNADDPRLRAYIGSAKHHAWRNIPVGTSETARLRATTVKEEGSAGISFDLAFDGASLGRFHLPIPGLHNLSNALAALAAVLAAEDAGGGQPVSREALARAVATLRLPARRFETVSTDDGIRVIADYAHHPAELAAAIAMGRATLAPGARLIGVFQPHRPSRTKALGTQFPAAFTGLDALALAPVYAASEPPLPGGSTADLYALFRQSVAGPAPSGPFPVLLPTLSSALPWLRHTVRPGDTVLLLGAGDIINLVPSFRPGWAASATLPPTHPEATITPAAATAPFCSLGVGGPARALVQVGSLVALRHILAWCAATSTPWRVLGAGTNFLVSDVGFDGLLLRLEGPAFQGGSGDSPVLSPVGAALPGARLLSSWQNLGYSGLECMDGIPGTVGGWLAMNAGAQGHAIGDCLVSLTFLAPDGSLHTVPRADLDLGYRHAAFRGHPLSKTVLLSATFAPLERTTPEVVAERRAAFRAKRFDFSGLRTAGSVFRNPPGDSAGRILDAAGLKGLRIGGAEICPRHANIISTHPGATASDVLALIQIARQRAPVPLVPEISLL